jgi:hypothetical protein
VVNDLWIDLFSDLPGINQYGFGRWLIGFFANIRLDIFRKISLRILNGIICCFSIFFFALHL